MVHETRLFIPSESRNLVAEILTDGIIICYLLRYFTYWLCTSVRRNLRLKPIYPPSPLW